MPTLTDIETSYNLRKDYVLSKHTMALTGWISPWNDMAGAQYSKAILQYRASENEYKAIALGAMEAPSANLGLDSAAGPIDFYWPNCLRWQVRKYFLHKDDFQPWYTQLMYDCAKAWTVTDPLSRRHPDLPQEGSPPFIELDTLVGSEACHGNTAEWGPRHSGVCVDKRGTDNIRSAVISGIYLFAEETENAATTASYKDIVLRYATYILSVGLGEWDSPGYNSVSAIDWMNLYDFAQDTDIKMAAKFVLDHYFTSLAMKYFRGTCIGPTKRTGSFMPIPSLNFAGEQLAWLAFGGSILMPEKPSSSLAAYITSSYRPPLPLYDLAAKEFDDVEFLNSKATYDRIKYDMATIQQAFFETLYIDRDCMLGSITRSADYVKIPDKWNSIIDVKAFEAVFANAELGAEKFITNCNGDFTSVGIARTDELVSIAQNKNLLIWLRPGQSTYQFRTSRLPTSSSASMILWTYQTHWLALLPLNLTGFGEAAGSVGSDRMFEATSSGPFSGFCLVVGKLPIPTVGQFTVDSTNLESGIVSLSYNGRSVSHEYVMNDQPVVTRDGVVATPALRGLIRDSNNAMIVSPWRECSLTIKGPAGDYVRQIVDGQLVESNPA